MFTTIDISKKLLNVLGKKQDALFKWLYSAIGLCFNYNLSCKKKNKKLGTLCTNFYISARLKRRSY